jgi:Rps23 Pro-64 3,4-dihydroxylase Tpa1-like proline 4-hydroxylase
MDIQAEKLKLVQAVLNIDDINVIKAVEEFLTGQQMDWFDGLSPNQQESVMRSLQQADSGEIITHQEAIGRLGL